MDTGDLIFMMFDDEPIETFEKLIKEENAELKWDELLDMCWAERNYESVGGDSGDSENPTIDYERLDYLEKLISLLESYGIKLKKP